MIEGWDKLNELEISSVSSKVQHLNLAFQPMIEVTESGHIIKGYEFLLRYQDGNYFPFDIFEELIATEACCNLLNAWYEQNISKCLLTYPDSYFSLNIDLQQMLYPSTWTMLKKLSEFSKRLSIELTEFYQVSNVEYQSIFPKAMDYIRNLGMKIAFDDVGNGQHSIAFVTSNLHYVDTIKLSLLHFKHIDNETVRLLIDLWIKVAEEFNTYFIVEGVEDEAIVTMLLEKGVHNQQGYYWSAPCKTIS